ncbi:3-hydroxyacyl-CoA dehydrogenase NAD-binding domain-containing protein [Pseudonocardia acidicola]|uniref:3-hydroxyacyl-CoA dehydrogenase NAD-binding domain-containing protein n=1 Tax=Pseudonocardia acidicola TaxID=2724939 RepID=UPI003084550E
MTQSVAAQRIGVIGAGTMGVGIAYVFAAAGAEVTVVEPDAERAATALRIAAHQAARAAERGKLDAAAAQELPDRLTSSGRTSSTRSGRCR